MKSIHIIALAFVLFSLPVQSEELDCDQALTTLDINRCAALELQAAEAIMQRYLDRSLQHHSDDAQLVEAIQQAQSAWLDYREAHCRAIYTQWREGTIRGVMTLSCKTRLTTARTHELWAEFLTFMDETEPVLPRPTQAQAY